MLVAPRNRRNATERGTMQQTISEAARLYGKARSTIHRAIDAGRLSCSVRGDGVRVIQLAELIRLWGEPPNAPPQAQQNATPDEPPAQQALVAELRALREELAALRREVAELRTLPAPGSLAPHPDDRHDTPAPAEAQATPPAGEGAPKEAGEDHQGRPRDFDDIFARFEARTRH